MSADVKEKTLLVVNDQCVPACTGDIFNLRSVIQIFKKKKHREHKGKAVDMKHLMMEAYVVCLWPSQKNIPGLE